MSTLPRAPAAVIAAFALSSCGIFISSHHDPLAYKEIHAAAQAGDLAKVTELYRRDHGVVNAKEWDNLTPLHLAVLHRHSDVVDWLLNHKANANAKTSKGITALHYAAQVGDADSARLLLKHHAEINAVDANSWTPLDRALKWHQTKLAAFLQNHGGKTHSERLRPSS